MALSGLFIWQTSGLPQRSTEPTVSFMQQFWRRLPESENFMKQSGAHACSGGGQSITKKGKPYAQILPCGRSRIRHRRARRGNKRQ
jgi:hypothetical protein